MCVCAVVRRVLPQEADLLCVGAGWWWAVNVVETYSVSVVAPSPCSQILTLWLVVSLTELPLHVMGTLQMMPDCEGASQLLCTLSSRYARARSQPPNDAQQDIKNVSVTQANGATILQFTRLRVTGDSQDLPLDSPFFLLFAWNGPISGICTYGYHGFTTRVASSNMTTLPTAQQCPGE